MEYGARAPSRSTAPTESTEANAAGELGWLVLSLPAAATSSTPAALAASHACCNTLLRPGPPRLMLTMSARCVGSWPLPLVSRAANRMPSAMSLMLPPPRPNTRTCISLQAQSTPAMPLPLSLRAPIVPATCVPWKLLPCGVARSPTSSGLPSRPVPSRATDGSLIMSKPGTTRAGSKSGCAALMPVSRTATITLALPVVRSQACGRLICG